MSRHFEQSFKAHEKFFEISGFSSERELFKHEHVVQLCAIWTTLHAHPSISAFVTVTDPLESSARCPRTCWRALSHTRKWTAETNPSGCIHASHLSADSLLLPPQPPTPHPPPTPPPGPPPPPLHPPATPPPTPSSSPSENNPPSSKLHPSSPPASSRRSSNPLRALFFSFTSSEWRSLGVAEVSWLWAFFALSSFLLQASRLFSILLVLFQCKQCFLTLELGGHESTAIPLDKRTEKAFCCGCSPTILPKHRGIFDLEFWFSFNLELRMGTRSRFSHLKNSTKPSNKKMLGT